MLPEAKGEALIYVLGATSTYIVSYQRGTVVKTFANPGAFWAESLCSDSSGNVFIPIKDAVLKYEHGGTVATAKLSDAGEYTYGCSVDAVTGNLAVVNYSRTTSGPHNNIAIYNRAAGKPALVRDPLMKQYFSCAYDNAGNLLVTGEEGDGAGHLAELPLGSHTFQEITLNEQLYVYNVQWDGQHPAVGDGGENVYQVAISGSTATVVGKTVMRSRKGRHLTFVIQGNVLLSPTGPGLNTVGWWKYPRGGGTSKRYFVAKKAYLGGLTISVAPDR